MHQEALLELFEELVVRSQSLTRVYRMPAPYPDEEGYDEKMCQSWAVEAEAALAAVFPETHPVRLAWSRILATPSGRDICFVAGKLTATFAAARNLIRDDRLASLVDMIRVESESELLDQAQVLVEANHHAAAAVIAGGALESHLRHYVDKHGITFTGAGSISTYNSAVGKARKANPAFYSANDGKLVEAWGGFRNEAAHDPGNFARTKDDVKRMIEGVREFIGRTS